MLLSMIYIQLFVDNKEMFWHYLYMCELGARILGKDTCDPKCICNLCFFCAFNVRCFVEFSDTVKEFKLTLVRN